MSKTQTFEEQEKAVAIFVGKFSAHRTRATPSKDGRFQWMVVTPEGHDTIYATDRTAKEYLQRLSNDFERRVKNA